MGDILSNFFSQATDSATDQTLAYSAMSSAAGGAGAYLVATLQASTPELRAILEGFTQQKIAEHSSISAYMMNKGWMSPYSDPVQQLETTYKQASSVINQH